MGMPKPKPDQVIRFEVVLGSVERDLLRDLRTSYAFGQGTKVLNPLVTMMDDANLWTKEGMALFLFMISIIFDVDIPYFPDPTDIDELRRQFNQYRDDNKDTPAGEDRIPPSNLGGAIYNLRNPNWNFSDWSFSALTGGIFD